MKSFDNHLSLALVILIGGMVISLIVASYFGGIRRKAEVQLKIEQTKLEQMRLQQKDKPEEKLDKGLNK